MCKRIFFLFFILSIFPTVFATNNYQQINKQQRLKQLTPMQYDVTQKGATEPPFKNRYWNNTQPGIYVDIVTGEPLFSSTDQFKSGTGWPSFTKPINNQFIVKTPERTWWLGKRIEVSSKYGESHLGHVFNDGPAPTGLRYCINSAALRFIPVDQMEAQGYGQYLYLFNQKPKNK